MEKIVLVGAGGHAKVLVDTIENLSEYEIAGFIAQGEIGQEIYRGYRIIGNDEDRGAVFESGIHFAVIAVGCVGKSDLRRKLFQMYKKSGFEFPVIVDASAVVAKDAVTGEGTYIGKKAVINANAQIGKNCIINTSAVVEHECVIGDFSHVSVSAVICGQVKVGNDCMIGSNSTVIQGKSIGDGCIVGAGAVVVTDVESGCTVAGVPARVIKK